MQQTRGPAGSILKSDWGVYLSFPKKPDSFSRKHSGVRNWDRML
jgi:hypothetical protein